MVSTFHALAATAVALLPGALYTWAFEREIGSWGIGFMDRILRFFGVSAVFWALYAWPAWMGWSRYVHKVDATGAVENPLAMGQAVPSWIWLVPVGYIVLPLIAGSLGATALRRRFNSSAWRVLSRVLVGPAPAPRAWDHVFSPTPAVSGLIRIRLRESDGGGWLGGFFGKYSYAGGLPFPSDIYLQTAYQMADNGTFESDERGDPVPLGSGILIERTAIAFLEFFPKSTGKPGKFPSQEDSNGEQLAGE